MPAQKLVQPTIPSNVSTLLEQFDVVETPSSAPSWDFVWNALVEEGREKGMLSLPFTHQVDVLPFRDESISEEMCLAESALKVMTIKATRSYRHSPHSNSSDGSGNTP